MRPAGEKVYRLIEKLSVVLWNQSTGLNRAVVRDEKGENGEMMIQGFVGHVKSRVEP